MIEPTTRKDLTDNELMLKVQNGNLQMMGLLYERHRVEAYAYFYRCTNSKDKSEDLVHNLFMRLIKYRHTFRGDGEFRYWLFATARNVWYDDHRKKNPLRHGEDIDQAFHLDDESSPQAELEKKERKKLVHEALLRLSPEKREAIVLSRFQGMKYQEIALIANCTENAIKSRVQRGLIELKEIIEHTEI